MSGTYIDIAHLIDSNWVRFTPDEQQVIQQRIHDLVMLTLSNALDDAVSPSEPRKASVPVLTGTIAASDFTEGRVSAADVPFGGPGQEPDYTYDDFAKLCEDHGVPPTAGIGHWFGKSEGVEFDKSDAPLRRKVYAEMTAFYANQRVVVAPVQTYQPPVAVVQQPYVAVELNICPSCGQGSKFVPPGVSKKSGKPYSGFYSCAKRPPCMRLYNGQMKDVTWTTDSDWTKVHNAARGAA